MTQTPPARQHVLLLGARGMLGRAWCAWLQSRGQRFTTASRRECDLTRTESIRAAVNGRHGLVINCAAFSDVDGAEQQSELADRINGEAVGVLAHHCRETGALLVHYSTDYVFNGRASAPYRTDEPRDPINAYGRSKAVGEAHLEASGCRSLLVRTSWLYAPWGRNFVRAIGALAAQRDSLRVVDDQRGRPTSAEDLVRATWSLIERGAAGVWHVTDGGDATWYELACRIVQRLNPGCRVEPCTSEQFPRPAARPAYSILDLTETEGAVGPMPDWQVNLAHVLDRLETGADG